MIHSILAAVRSFLANTFSEVDVWFNQADNLLDFRPSTGGWTIREILEHIGLTN